MMTIAVIMMTIIVVIMMMAIVVLGGQYRTDCLSHLPSNLLSATAVHIHYLGSCRHIIIMSSSLLSSYHHHSCHHSEGWERRNQEAPRV